MHQTSKQKGLNLIELMIVIAIVGILASIGYPLYKEQMDSSRRTDAKTSLLEVLEAQERFYSANNTYATTLTSIGYATATVPSDEGFYGITAAQCAGPIALTQCISLSAAPAVGGPQTSDGCGTLSIDSRGNKGKTGALPLSKCW